MKAINHLAITASAALLLGCAHAPPDDPHDPLEKVNRAVFKFNRTTDKYVLRPVAKGYKAITPRIAQKGVSNFLNNLEEPRTIVNDIFQLKLKQAGRDTGRFLLNTTAGFVGVMDVATQTGLVKHEEDFGQTLGHYGVNEGWYLMLPFLGPSSTRELVGKVVDTPVGATYYLKSPRNIGFTAARAVPERADYLDADELLDGAMDPYVFIRTVYLQQRLGKVYDGNVPSSLMYGGEEEAAENAAIDKADAENAAKNAASTAP